MGKLKHRPRPIHIKKDCILIHGVNIKIACRPQKPVSYFYFFVLKNKLWIKCYMFIMQF